MAVALFAAALHYPGCSGPPPLVSSSGTEMQMSRMLMDTETRLVGALDKLSQATTPAAADSVLKDLQKRLPAMEQAVAYCRDVVAAASAGEYAEAESRLGSVTVLADKLISVLGVVEQKYPGIGAAKLTYQAYAIKKKAQ